MKGRQKLFLEKIVKLLVDDTVIDYYNGEMYFNFLPTPSLRGPFRFNSPLFFLRSFFSKYCINTFGLNEEEINYVWGEYRVKLRNKTESDER